MLSQSRQTPPFPIENPDLGAGRAPLLMSVPVAYYTTLFRPQLWGFFVLDFERGFSFYWCCKVFDLLLAAGWFLWQLGLRHRGLVLFGTVWIFFSSYVQWWFSTPAMLPEMVTTWAICTGCAIQFFKHGNALRLLAVLAVFLFFGVNFVLCLYPPFQIPLLYLSFTLVAGVWIERRRTQAPWCAWRGTLLIGAGLAAIVLVLLPFWVDVRSTLDLLNGTVYPGGRRSSGGDLSLLKLLSGTIGFFESERAVPSVYENICEASNFYPLWLPAAIGVLVARWRNRSPVTPLVAALLLLLAGLSLYCLVPVPKWILRMTLLTFTTERRTLLVIGLANILFCCLFLQRYTSRIFTRRGALAIGLVFCFAIAALLYGVKLRDPASRSDTFQAAAVTWNGPLGATLPLLVNIAILTLFFWEEMRRWLPTAFGALLVFSNGGINPVMRGLSPLLDSDAFRTIEKIRATDPRGKWIVYEDLILVQLVKATGAKVLNGIKILPDLSFLRRLDPKGDYDSIYNRYANILCELPQRPGESNFALVFPNLYIMFLPPELAILEADGYRYVLFPRVWANAPLFGFSLIHELEANKIWIYQRLEGTENLRSSASPLAKDISVAGL